MAKTNKSKHFKNDLEEPENEVFEDDLTDNNLLSVREKLPII